ncbi:complex III assembly factor LYRM7-like [Antedon mediterranea]|uniref:complex III assembly factor LYRM7-like n=1 Tax=Antedon mediterranea TaxID=105859 RepID=UPI003AF536A6
MREKVLATFRALHRTRQMVFKNDDHVLNAARLKINEEFKKNKFVEDGEEIERLVKIGQDAELFLRKRVVQAEHKSDGVAELQLRNEVLSENAKQRVCDQETVH